MVAARFVEEAPPDRALRDAKRTATSPISSSSADCEYLLDQAKVKNEGLCLNMGHMTTLREEGWTLLARFPERVHVLAWKNHLVGENLPQPAVSCELGEGKTPFQQYADVYRKVPCRSLHLITFGDVPLDEKKEALRRSHGYLVKLLEG